MSTISASSAAVHTSPKQRILDTIASQVKSGQISSTDQTALSSAVDDIDGALTGGAESGASSAAQQLSPSAMKGRIDDLIANEVSNGTLTSDQATALKSVFAQGGKDGGGHGGVGGPGGAGSPPPGPPPGGDDSSGVSTAATGTSAGETTASSSAATGASDLLASFIKQLQSTQAQASAYSSSGSNGGSRLSSAILLDFEA